MTDKLSLFELNKLVKATLDANLAPSYWVVAEIGELRTNYTGHCYLELVEKEDDKVIAKSRATIWAYTYRNLSTWFEGMTGKALQPGLKILCNVSIQYHELYGFSLNIKDIDANFTLGERARKRKEIIDRLVADGIFDMNKSLSLPQVPQNIAIISSPTAAGFGDFVNQLESNSGGYHFKIQLFKATVQGDGAAESMIQALHQIHNGLDNFDLVCLIRGGGSQIDLDCFDHYELASHVAQFPLPVLTGIGHDRDETIADLVSHTRLKTPTAVAEFLINGVRIFEEALEVQFSQLYHLTNQIITNQKQSLQRVTQNMKSASKELLRHENSRTQYLKDRLLMQSKNELRAQQSRLENLDKHLSLINPLTILERGYTITLKNGKRIGTETVKKGDEIQTITAKQVIKSKVEKAAKRDE
ncbi:exodeoxyribonuclease VII large subunit [Fulvivirga sp. RKSG066]|uniref:exodeoxyribonuclease VII large subunit n=1 Tax=Fulvivirga aurantia TaxID=2529383 RepID=UPI0012BB7B41|nr:exodeoxyribonuclease VII large subunit [Fulvivirga aurantia]MTI20704.1 exodeoxyribonuclease VII large subunit [Fulvivirga aurantia]